MATTARDILINDAETQLNNDPTSLDRVKGLLLKVPPQVDEMHAAKIRQLIGKIGKAQAPSDKEKTIIALQSITVNPALDFIFYTLGSNGLFVLVVCGAFLADYFLVGKTLPSAFASAGVTFAVWYGIKKFRSKK